MKTMMNWFYILKLIMSQLRTKFEQTFDSLTLQISKNPVCLPCNQKEDYKKFGLATNLIET